mgnify:CR=1 FL=1
MNDDVGSSNDSSQLYDAELYRTLPFNTAECEDSSYKPYNDTSSVEVSEMSDSVVEKQTIFSSTEENVNDDVGSSNDSSQLYDVE